MEDPQTVSTVVLSEWGHVFSTEKLRKDWLNKFEWYYCYKELNMHPPANMLLQSGLGLESSHMKQKTRASLRGPPSPTALSPGWAERRLKAAGGGVDPTPDQQTHFSVHAHWTQSLKTAQHMTASLLFTRWITRYRRSPSVGMLTWFLSCKRREQYI